MNPSHFGHSPGYHNLNHEGMEAHRDKIVPDAGSESLFLGDFGSIRDAFLQFQPPHNLLTAQWSSEGDVKLGNLSKIVNQLRKNIQTEVFEKDTPSSTDQALSAKPPDKSQSSINTGQYTILQRERPAETESTDPHPAHNADSESYEEGVEKFIEPISKHSQSLPHIRGDTTSGRKNSRLGQLLAYQLVINGPFSFVFSNLHTENEAQNSLSHKLSPIFNKDTICKEKSPRVTEQGIHVFLDMSNIDISFHKCLRRRHQLPMDSRFNPLPRLNLAFLTKILLRGRAEKRMFAGCSVSPTSTSEPRFIQRLRDLGFTTDVRTRKRTDEPVMSSVTHTGVRYVEDLVDETLQTRMAESAMAFFQSPGIMVLATGDGRPAQFSDGFFAYVDRALQMGWNVELVSWQESLSTSWRNSAWRQQWGDRFRIIELDQFVDELLDCYFDF